MFAGGARQYYGSYWDAGVATIWQAYDLIGWDAVTLCDEDLSDFASIGANTRKATVALNLTQGDKPAVPPVLYKQVKLANGKKIRVGILGIVGPSGNPAMRRPSNVTVPVTVTDAVTALSSQLPLIRKKADVIVALYGGMRADATVLLGANPDIDLMVIGQASMPNMSDGTMEQVGKTWVVQNTDRGRNCGLVGLTIDPKTKRVTGAEQQRFTVSPAIADEPAVAKIVEAYKQAQVVSSPRSAYQVAAGKGEWAGSNACQTCHSPEFQQWFGSRHARAFTTLERDDNGRSAKRGDCVVCHVVAFDKPGGFSFAEPWADLKGVGCESCHGPSAAHVRFKTRGEPDTAKPVAKPGREACQTCHTNATDPDFEKEYDIRLLRIVHKEPPGGRPAPRPSSKAKPATMSGASS